MHITIKSNYGSQVIDTDNFSPSVEPCSSVIYRMIEDRFNKWFADIVHYKKDYIGMYQGEGDQPAIYTKSGAIVGGMETFIELANELGRSVLNEYDIYNMDIEAAFE